jgi:uncharacterized protein with HEPN domain
MKKDDSVYLEHILMYIIKLEKFSANFSYSDFSSDESIQNNIIRYLEVIGEASIKISKDLKEKYQDIPWAKIKGMRNILIHDYGSVSIDVVWNTAKTAMTPLKEQIIKIIEDTNPQILLNYK